MCAQPHGGRDICLAGDGRPLNIRISKNSFCLLAIFLLPFVLFYWMIPFASNMTLGTDYINYHVFHQLDLLFSVKSGSFPLYAPACYYGQSSVYPHAQLYHPLGYLAALMPGFWQGFSLDWLTLFRLITLAFCHLYLFYFLKQMRLTRMMAFIISLVTVYNLRMLALFWNATALEAYTGTIFLCAAIGCYYLKQTGWRLPLLIIGATYWLINSDFPPMVFYGVIGAAVFTLTLPFLHNAISDGTEKNGLKEILRFWGKTGLSFGTGLVLSSAYLLPFFLDYMPGSSGRVDQPYAWAVQWTDTLAGFLNNWFFPLGSGFSMFGGSPLFLAALAAPVALILFRQKVPAVIWWLLGVIILCCLYMQGDRTPVHHWAWEYLPLVSALRGPGRIALVLPLLFMMILTWLAAPGLNQNRPWTNRPMNPAVIVAFVLIVVYACWPGHFFVNTGYGCPYNIRSIPAWVRPVSLATSLIILGLLFVYAWRPEHNRIIGLVMTAVMVFYLVVIFRYGPYATEIRQKTPTYVQILAQKRAAINFQPVFFLNQHAGSSLVVRQLKNYFMEPDLAKIYRRYTIVADRDEAYRRLNAGRRPDEVVIEEFSALPADSTDYIPCKTTPDRVRLTYAAYNRLVFSATACQPSFFVFSYPRSGHWRARLDGHDTVTYAANGAAHGVWLPAGQHTVEFRYWSTAAVCGMMISCLILALIIGLAGISGFGGVTGSIVGVAGFVCSSVLLCLWYGGLYNGDNLGTVYQWQSSPPSTSVNLAFGKPTQMSSHRPGYPYLYNSRHAVDGGRGVDSCFFTDREKEPWWQVDLGGSRPVGRIVLYTGFAGGQFNGPPLTVSISEDGRQWRETRVNKLNQNDGLTLAFEPAESARYINIKASGEGVLSLNEVEVYGPQAE